MNILYVEDNQTDAMLLKMILERHALDMVWMDDIQAALYWLFDNRPDVIVVDICMPGDLSGLDFVQMIRQDPVFAYTPILFLTGADTSEIRFRVRQLPNCQFVSKPYDMKSIINAIAAVAV